MTAWLIRAGRSGERDEWSLEKGLSGGGFREVGDLTGCQSRADVIAAVETGFPGASKGKISNFSGQLWALRSAVKAGDLVVLPLKSTGQIALGRITGGYEYREDPDPSRRHVVPVRWEVTDLPRTSLHQDLLYSLGAFMTICAISRNDAEWRLEQALKSGKDPGQRIEGATTPKPQPEQPEADADWNATAAAVDFERAARDRIAAFITERYMGHGLTDIVADILRAEGYTCHVSPPGPDNSVDIYAGLGPLGLDSPRLVVQVKSEASPVGSPVVTQLSGAVSNNNADQGLLVAWGGLKKPAQDEMRRLRHNMALWDADALIDRLFKAYPNISEALRAELPLKQIWVLVEETQE